MITTLLTLKTIRISKNPTKTKFKAISHLINKILIMAFMAKYQLRAWDLQEHQPDLLIISIILKLKLSLHRRTSTASKMIGHLLRSMHHQEGKATSLLVEGLTLPMIMKSHHTTINNPLWDNRTWIRDQVTDNNNPLNPNIKTSLLISSEEVLAIMIEVSEANQLEVKRTHIRVNKINGEETKDTSNKTDSTNKMNMVMYPSKDNNNNSHHMGKTKIINLNRMILFLDKEFNLVKTRDQQLISLVLSYMLHQEAKAVFNSSDCEILSHETSNKLISLLLFVLHYKISLNLV